MSTGDSGSGNRVSIGGPLPAADSSNNTSQTVVITVLPKALNWSYSAPVPGSGQVRNVAVITGPTAVTIPDTSVLIVDSDRYANIKVTEVFNDSGPNPGIHHQRDHQRPDTVHDVVMADHLESMLAVPLSFTTSKGTATFDQNTGNNAWAIPGMPNGKYGNTHVYG
ncbi:hypothetical protein [Chitinophaga sp. sic0106]|uniref:hypothetical protein n=1 Tax=Chitinophaga sp. sic0106 TaxID=2854785 RepID=UPI001C44058C|nr:hypothetical protein [Chitinophaga sp. sic0106]MBV7529152.1 hypothetical protein [Chitinophaga sp. sic0106]